MRSCGRAGPGSGISFSDLVRLRVTFQQLALVRRAAGVARARWVDFDAAFYGHGLVEPHGMKVAADNDGVEMDPDERPIEATPEAAEQARATSAQPLPRWPPRRCAERPACHYGLTADGHSF